MKNASGDVHRWRTTLPTDYAFEDEYGVVSNNTYFYWIESVESSGVTELHGPTTLTIPEEEIVPIIIETVLKGNFPNPFNPSTIIKFDVAENKTAELIIYNVKGQVIESKFFDESGEHFYHWDATEYGSGVYLYELRSDNYIETKKMLMVK